MSVSRYEFESGYKAPGDSDIGDQLFNDVFCLITIILVLFVLYVFVIVFLLIFGLFEWQAKFIKKQFAKESSEDDFTDLTSPTTPHYNPPLQITFSNATDHSEHSTERTFNKNVQEDSLLNRKKDQKYELDEVDAMFEKDWDNLSPTSPTSSTGGVELTRKGMNSTEKSNHQSNPTSKEC